jgi:protein-S-isoprenylcysteine O-methyltransferase Ste14
LLYQQLERQGAVLFRWRGILPLVLIPALLLASLQSAQFKHWFGEPVEEVFEVLCGLLAFLGLLVRCLTVGFVPAGTSGRNTSGQRATRLNTTGPYSVVRNPLYLGNFLILLGMALLSKVWWFPLLAELAFALYYERIIVAEESFLARRFGRAYVAWAARTPAFMPDPRPWQPPRLAFSFRTVLRREHSGLLTVVVGLTLVELLSDVLGEGEALSFWGRNDIGWVIFMLFGVVLGGSAWFVKRRTSWLVVAGR